MVPGYPAHSILGLAFRQSQTILDANFWLELALLCLESHMSGDILQPGEAVTQSPHNLNKRNKNPC